jgi:hypothetical protein
LRSSCNNGGIFYDKKGASKDGKKWWYINLQKHTIEK